MPHILIYIILAFILGWALFRVIRERKKEQSASVCSGDCAHCPAAQKEKQHSKDFDLKYHSIIMKGKQK